MADRDDDQVIRMSPPPDVNRLLASVPAMHQAQFARLLLDWLIIDWHMTAKARHCDTEEHRAAIKQQWQMRYNRLVTDESTDSLSSWQLTDIITIQVKQFRRRELIDFLAGAARRDPTQINFDEEDEGADQNSADEPLKHCGGL